MATVELEANHGDVLNFHNHKLVKSGYFRFLNVKALVGTFNKERA